MSRVPGRNGNRMWRFEFDGSPGVAWACTHARGVARKAITEDAESTEDTEGRPNGTNRGLRGCRGWENGIPAYPRDPRNPRSHIRTHSDAPQKSAQFSAAALFLPFSALSVSSVTSVIAFPNGLRGHEYMFVPPGEARVIGLYRRAEP